jgi:hypothetical protein
MLPKNSPPFLASNVMTGPGGPYNFTMPAIVHRQNSVGPKSIDYSDRYLHTPTHDRDIAMAGHFHNCSCPSPKPHQAENN